MWDLRFDDATATRTSKNNRFYGTQKNNFARATLFIHFFSVSCTTTTRIPDRVLQSRNPDPKFHAIPYSRGLFLASHLPISQRTWTSNNEILFLFLTFNIVLGIQLLEGLPTFDKVSGRNKSR